jgi:hypothetical protein
LHLFSTSSIFLGISFWQSLPNYCLTWRSLRNVNEANARKWLKIIEAQTPRVGIFVNVACPNKRMSKSFVPNETGLVELDNPSIPPVLESQSTASHNALPTHTHFPKLPPCCFMSSNRSPHFGSISAWNNQCYAAVEHELKTFSD